MKHFEIGQPVVLHEGVGLLADKSPKTVLGQTNDYYKIVRSGCTRYVPAKRIKLACRPLSTPQEIHEAFKLLAKKPRPHSGLNHKQMDIIEERRRGLSLTERAALIRDLFTPKGVERTNKTPIYEDCLDIFAEECSMVLQQPKDVMIALITDTIVTRAVPTTFNFE